MFGRVLAGTGAFYDHQRFHNLECAGWVTGNIYTESVFWNVPVGHVSMISISADQLDGMRTHWGASTRDWPALRQFGDSRLLRLSRCRT